MTNLAHLRESPPPAEFESSTSFATKSRVARASLRIAAIIAVAAFAALRLHELGWSAIAANLPISTDYYAFFAIGYVTLPIFDATIYSRLWNIRFSDLLPIMFRKRVLNESVLGYSGEAFLALWARQHAYLSEGSAAKSIIDSNLVSSFVSTLATMVLAAAALSVLPVPRASIGTLGGGVAFAAVILCVMILLRGKILGLRGGPLIRVATLHSLRLMAVLAFQILQWNSALPDAPLAAWIIVMAAYFLATRIPFLPSYDLILLSLGLSVAPAIGLPPVKTAGLFMAGAALNQAANLIVFLATSTERQLSDRKSPAPQGRVPSSL